MPNLSFETVSETVIKDVIDDLCSKGLYTDALTEAENAWGPISRWNSYDQIIIAIRLYMNLGGDRHSDFLLLTLWRKQKQNPNLLNKVLFYKLNKLGPILAEEFLTQHELTILEEPQLESDLLGFKSILQKIFKNYSVADKLIEQAITINPEDSWLTYLKIQLLNDQNELIVSKELAEQHFAHFPSPDNLRVLSEVFTQFYGVKASITLYEKHVNKYQSANVWLEYAQLLASVHDWSKCEHAIERFEELRIVKDKGDEKFLISWKGQIAIHNQEIDKGIELLSKSNSFYWKTVTENLTNAKGKLERKVLEVPFLRQEHMTCAPTTLAALCRYWGKNFNSTQIADEICFDGTPDTKEREWLRDNNFYYQEFELASDLAYALIDKNIPFALVTTSGFSAHLQAVIGYNKQVGTLYVMDPSHSIMQEMLTKETIKSEAYSGARCIAFVPKEQSDLLAEFDFPASTLYPLWDNYSRAKQQSDFVAARSALTQLKTIDLNHRITLRVERDFAIWNSDTYKTLELNNKLLETFPNETVLLNSKYFCLRDLGRREEGLALLNDYLNFHTNLDLLGTLFSEIYDTNEHKALTQHVLIQLKTFGGYSANAHWLLANYYWSQQAFSIATEHYLYAYCLDETNSQYIESFFNASRYLNKEQEAIAFLIDRFNKYKIRSALPAISLYKAYELLDQEHVGIDYLIKALELHTSDKVLISYLSRKLIDTGLIEQFTDIEKQIENHLDKSDFEELIARKNEQIGDLESALSYFHRVFSKNPFIYKYANGYFRLLLKRGDNCQVDDILESLFQQHPSNTRVLDYIADWHSDPVFQEQVLIQFVELRPDYGVIRRQLIDVRLRLGKNEEALLQAQETYRNIVGEHINQSYLAKCHLKLGNLKEAIIHSKQVLKVAVDNDLAFSTLMEASISRLEKELSLDFVFSQIQTQITFGDSAWNYWFEAKSILSQEKLKDFIDYLLTQQNHLWYTYSLSANYFKQYGDLTKAKELLLEGQSKFPLTPQIYNDLGQLYELEGDITQSIQAYSQALVMNPSWANVTRRLSDVLERNGDIEEATNVLSNGIKHNPNDGILHGYLADLLIKQGQNEKAIEPLKYAVMNNTNYRWAWNQLINIANEQGQTNLPYKIAIKLVQQSPYLPHVWRDLAYVTDDKTEKFELLDKAIQCDKYYAPVYFDKAQYFVHKGEYKKALGVLDNTPWKEDLPVELTIQKVDLLVAIGQKNLAAKYLKQVLFSVHGHAHLWKKLFDLLELGENKQEYLECCYKSVEQNRYDAEILCYVGENILKHGSRNEKETAQNFLKEAFKLSPNDQYIVLTYVDNLIESKDFSAALSALKVFETNKIVNYAKAREVNVLCQLGRAEEALIVYQEVILNKESDYWCLNQSFNALNTCYTFDELAKLFFSKINDLTREQAYFYTDKCLNITNNIKYQQVLNDIKSYSNSAAWEGGFLALLEYWNDNKMSPSVNIVNTYFKRIIKSPILISKLVNGYINAKLYLDTIKLFEHVQDIEELPAIAFYHYRLALQMLDRWEEATSIIRQGVKQQPDSTVHNMRIWFAYELHRTNKNLTYEDIEVINYEALDNTEQYVYSMLLVVLALDNKTFESKQQTLVPLLKKCQQDYQNANVKKLAQKVRNSLIVLLNKSIDTSQFFNKLKLKWWIRNNV